VSPSDEARSATTSQGLEPAAPSPAAEDPAERALAEIKSYAKDWREHTDKIPEVARRLWALILSSNEKSVEVIAAARRWQATFQIEVEAESVRRIDMNTWNLKPLVGTPQYCKARREMEDLARDFQGTSVELRMRAVLDEVGKLEQEDASRMVDVIQRSVAASRFHWARSMISRAEDAYRASTLGTISGYPGLVSWIHSLTPEHERELVHDTAWALVGAERYVDAEGILNEAISDSIHAGATGELEADLLEIGLVQRAIGDIHLGAKSLEDARQKLKLVSTAEEVSFECTGNEVMVIHRNGAHRRLADDADFTIEDGVRLAAFATGVHTAEAHFKAGLLFYAAYHRPQRNLANLAAAKAELSQALSLGEPRAGRHLQEIDEWARSAGEK